MYSLDIYKFLETNRWNSATDIPWDQFDDSTTDLQSRWIRNNCLGEFSTAPGTYAFMRDFNDDPELYSFMGVWLFEEQKHFLVQYEYLKRFRPHLVPTPDQIQNVNFTFEPVDNKYSLLFLHHCEELEVMTIYLNVSKDFTDPVAKEIYKTIAADESRHSKIFFDFCVKYLEKDYHAAADGFSKVALFLTSERRNKHPVLNIVNKTDPALGSVQSRKPEPDLYSSTWSKSVQEYDPSILRNKYLNSLSRLLGKEFTCAKDVLRFRKELRVNQHSN
jgi:hypothetical protein